MPDRRAVSSVRLLAARGRARAGLLASAAAAVAVAVATVCLLPATLARAVAAAGTPAPPGVEPDVVAAQVAEGAAALTSAVPALVILVALLAGTAVAQLARLVATAREQETAAVRARGLSGAQGWTADAVEGASIAVAGALMGVVLAAAAAAVTGSGPADVFLQWPWATALAVALAAVFTVALRRGERRRATARAAGATTGAFVVVVLLAAALVVWQLPQGRGAGFDPIVAVAPAVLLLAGAILALAVFGAGAVAWTGAAAAIPSLEPAYPARQVARRLPVYAVAVLLVVLAVSLTVFASAYSATWRAMTSDSSALRAGADLRVDTSPQSVSPGDVAAAAEVEGVDAAAPALTALLEVGESTAPLVAVPLPAVGPVVAAAGGLVDKAALTDAATVPDAVAAQPLPLGEAARGIRVRALLSGPSSLPSVTVFAVLLDDTGAPAAVALDETGLQQAADGTVQLTAEASLPPGTAGWRLLALAAGTGPTFADRTVTVEVTQVEALGGSALDVAGEVTLGDGSRDAVVWLADGGVLASGADAPPLAAVVTTAFAARLGLGEGDVFEFRYDGTGRRGGAVVSAIVPAVPGATSPVAVFAPLENLLVSQLQRGTSIVPPNSVWASGAASVDEFSAVLGDRPVVTATPGIAAALAGALIPGWWIATAGAAVLALVAAFAIVQTLALARRRELGVLRALGVTPRRQGAMRAGELGGVLGAALLLGVPAGLLASWLVVPGIVRAVTPGVLPLPTGVTLAWPPLLLGLALLLLGLAAIVALAAAGAVRDAGTATVGEEAR
jgi:hypothetical protein